MQNTSQINITIKLQWVWEFVSNWLIYLFSCLHFDTRFNHLLSNLSFCLKLLITSFFKRQRLLDFDPKNFFKMDHLIPNFLFWSFKPQMNFESLESFSCVRFLNGIVWLLYMDLNSVSLIPKLTFVDNSLMPSLVSTSAL